MTKEFEDRIYIKDKVDGQEHCLSGDKEFYLIDVTQEYKKHFLPKSKVREMIKKTFELGYSTGNDIQISQKYLVKEDKQRIQKIFNDLLKDLDL